MLKYPAAFVIKAQKDINFLLVFFPLRPCSASSCQQVCFSLPLQGLDMQSFISHEPKPEIPNNDSTSHASVDTTLTDRNPFRLNAVFKVSTGAANSEPELYLQVGSNIKMKRTPSLLLPVVCHGQCHSTH
jgi:hypothetical protein